jgi:anti-sigma factor RsiW
VTTVLPAVCERSRAFVSLALDGELAELEQRMLDAHLARCAPCRDDARELVAIAAAVRATPLEPVDGLATPRFRRPLTGRLRPVAAVAATLLLGIGAGGAAVRTAGEPGLDRAQQQTRWPVPSRYLSDRALLAEQQHIVMSRPGNAPLQLRF